MIDRIFARAGSKSYGGGRERENKARGKRGKNPLDNKARPIIVKYLGYLGYGFLYTTYVFLVTKTFFSKEKEKPNKDDQRKEKRRNRLPKNNTTNNNLQKNN